jgi:Holliday junction resolvase RusA-like endonuclease
MIFTFDIKPMAKQSVRLGNGFHYQPPAVVNYHNYLKLMCQQQMAGQTKYEVPIQVIIVAEFALPKSAKKADKDFIANGFTLPKSTKPDLDNLMKATLDPLNGLLWTDDALITEARITKRWAAQNKLIISVEKV